MNNAPFFGEHGYVPPARPNFQIPAFVKSLRPDQILGLAILVVFIISGIVVAFNKRKKQKESVSSKGENFHLPQEEQMQVQLVSKPTPTTTPIQNTNIMPGVYAQIPMERMQEFSYVQHLNGYVHQSQYHLVPLV